MPVRLVPSHNMSAQVYKTSPSITTMPIQGLKNHSSNPVMPVQNITNGSAAMSVQSIRNSLLANTMTVQSMTNSRATTSMSTQSKKTGSIPVQNMNSSVTMSVQSMKNGTTTNTVSVNNLTKSSTMSFETMKTCSVSVRALPVSSALTKSVPNPSNIAKNTVIISPVKQLQLQKGRTTPKILTAQNLKNKENVTNAKNSPKRGNIHESSPLRKAVIKKSPLIQQNAMLYFGQQSRFQISNYCKFTLLCRIIELKLNLWILICKSI